jgi:hypothetical protein
MLHHKSMWLCWVSIDCNRWDANKLRQLSNRREWLIFERLDNCVVNNGPEWVIGGSTRIVEKSRCPRYRLNSSSMPEYTLWSPNTEQRWKTQRQQQVLSEMQSAKQSHGSSRACSTDFWLVNPLSSRLCRRSDETPSRNPSRTASSNWIPPNLLKTQSAHFSSPEGGDRQTHDIKCPAWQLIFCFTGLGVVKTIGHWVTPIRSRFLLLFQIFIAGKTFFHYVPILRESIVIECLWFTVVNYSFKLCFEVIITSQK